MLPAGTGTQSFFFADHAQDVVFCLATRTIGSPPEHLVTTARKLIETTTLGPYEQPTASTLPLRSDFRRQVIEACAMRASADHPPAGSSPHVLIHLKQSLSKAPRLEQHQRLHALVLVGKTYEWLAMRRFRATKVQFMVALAKSLNAAIQLIETSDT
jgi:hypothetical protein